MSKIGLFLILTFVLVGGYFRVSSTEPDYTFTLEDSKQLFAKSEGIFIVEYKRYESDKKITLDNPPTAVYKLIEYLKGPPIPTALRIRYDFYPEQKNWFWKFDEKMLPKKNSKWIIYVEEMVPTDGRFHTTNGAKGRVMYNDENLDKALRVIEMHKGQVRVDD